MSQRPGQAAYNAARDLVPGVLDDLPRELDPFNSDDRLVAFQMWLREKGQALKTERVEARAALAAIRDALGCEPGDEVEAVRGLARAADALERSVARLAPHAAQAGVVAVAAGCTLSPDRFGKGEAGVLRLAGLLSEAPEGAVVRDSGGAEWARGPQPRGWVWRSFGVPALTAVGMARRAERAPLTVVAWPAGAS